MTLTENYVPWPHDGFAIAIQYWAGDEQRALRVARLIADIEPQPRADVHVYLIRRWDCPPSTDLDRTAAHVRTKFPVGVLQSDEPGEGHPCGANVLWTYAMRQLAVRWLQGSGMPSVLLAEHDSVPLSRDWIERLKLEHAAALSGGKRISGCLMERPGPIPHVNGSMLMHLSAWFDHPSLHVTPAWEAWDVWHRVVLGNECRPTPLIRNIYGARNWSPEALAALSKEVAWLANTKDDSALEWAERSLTGRSA